MHLKTKKTHTQFSRPRSLEFMSDRSPTEKLSDINASSTEGYTPLVTECIYMEKMKDASKEEKNAQLACIHDVLLQGAAICGALEHVEFLLSRGAKVNQVDGEGRTALISACRGGHHHVIHALLVHGADANLSQPHRKAPLAIALRNRDTVSAALLIAYGADDATIKFDAILETYAALRPLHQALSTWPSKKAPFHRRICAYYWLIAQLDNFAPSPSNTDLFAHWKIFEREILKQWEIFYQPGRACLVSILILGQAKTADDQPRYAQCGLYRLPSELLLYLILTSALLMPEKT